MVVSLVGVFRAGGIQFAERLGVLILLGRGAPFLLREKVIAVTHGSDAIALAGGHRAVP